MNAGSVRAQELLKLHEEQVERQKRCDLLSVMGTQEGRRFVWQLIGTAGVFQQSFDTEALHMAFYEGRRSIGLTLLARLQDEAPDLYLKAQSEHVESQIAANKLREAAEAEAANEQENQE